MANLRIDRVATRLARGGGSAVGGAAAANLFIGAMGAVTGVLAARLFGPAGRGDLAAIQLPGLLLAGFAMLGLPDAMVYLLARRESEARAVVRTAFSLSAMASLVLGLAAMPLMPMFLSGFPSSVILLAQVWLLFPLVTAFSGMPLMALRGAGFEAAWNVLRSAAALTWLVVLGACFLVPFDGRLGFAIAGQLLALSLLGGVSWIVLRRLTGVTLGFGSEKARPMLRYGLPLALTAVPQVFNFRLDQLLLVRWVSRADLGLYVTAVSWSSLIGPIVAAFGIVLFPRLSAESARERAGDVFVSYFRPALAAALTLGLLAALSASVIVPLLFGEDYQGSVASSQVLSAAGAVLALSGVLAAALQGLNATRTVLWTELLGLVVTLLALLALVPRFGIVGAAVASLVAYSATMLARLSLVLSLVDRSLASLLWKRQRGHS